MAFRGLLARGDAAGWVGCSPAVKAKRKDLEEADDDFFDLSLLSPARKIRRLDAELPQIAEEEAEPSLLARAFGQPVPKQQQQLAAGSAGVGSSLAFNEDRAIVLYKPVAHAPPLGSPLPPSNVTFRVDPDVIAGLKNDMFWSGQRKPVEATPMGGETPGGSDEEREAAAGSCSAVVPWMPSQVPETRSLTRATAAPVELAEVEMESEDAEGASMEVEEEDGGAAPVVTGNRGGFQQQQQQHCSMAPQVMIHPSTSSPIMWSWG